MEGQKGAPPYRPYKTSKQCNTNAYISLVRLSETDSPTKSDLAGYREAFNKGRRDYVCFEE